MTKLGKRRTIASGYWRTLLTTTALVSPLLLAAPAAAADYTGGNGAQGPTGSYPNSGCVCGSGQAGGAGGANGFGGGNAASGAANRDYANSNLGGYGGAADAGGGGGAFYATGAGGPGGGAGGAGYLLTDGNTLTNGGAVTGGNGGDGGYSNPYYFPAANYGIDGGGGGGGGGSGVIATGTVLFTNTGTILGGTGGTGAFVNSYNSSYNSYAPSSYADSGSGGAGGYGVRADSAVGLILNNSGNITGGDSGDHALIGQNNTGGAGIYGQNITLYNTGGTIKGGYGNVTGAGIELTGGTNTLNISAGTVTSNYYGIGVKVDSGTNTFNISGGAVTAGQYGTIALQINGGTNTLNVTGGTLGAVNLAGGATTLEGTAYSDAMTLSHGATASVTSAGGDVSGIASFDNHGGLSLDAGRSLTLGSFTNESDGTLTLGAGATLVSTNLNLIAGSTITGAGSLSSGSAAYALASGSISAALAGTGGLTKTGSGTLSLTGANTYTGGTIINGGTLAVAFGALGGGDVHMAQGTAIQFTGGSFTTTNSFFINGDPVFNVASGTQTVSGVIADDTGATPPVPGVVEKTGAGELLLTGANSYSGGTVISAGRLTVGTDSVYGVSSAVGLGTVTLDGGTLSTSAFHTLYNDIQINSTGGTIDSGANAFEVDGDITDGTGGPGTLTIDGTTGGAVLLGGTNTYSAATLVAAGATLQPSTFDALSANSNYTVNGTLNLRQLGGGDFTIKSLAGTGSVTNTLAGNSLLTIATAAAQTATFDGIITDFGGGNPHIGIAINGQGEQIFSNGANNYSGGTTITAGILGISNGHALGDGGVTLDGGILKAEAASLTLGNAILVDTAGGTINANSQTVTLSGNIADGNGAGTLSFTGGSVVLSGDNSGFSGSVAVGSGASLTLAGADAGMTGAYAITGTLDLSGNAAAIGALSGGGQIQNSDGINAATLTLGIASGSASFTGTIIDSGAALALVKNGAGTQTLSGANTYSGGTTLNAGTLTAGSNGALGTGQVTITGGTLSFANAVSLSNAIAFQGDATLAVATGMATHSGNITDDGNGPYTVTKAGAGTLVWSGTNTSSTTVKLSAGTLEIGSQNALGGGTYVFDGGTMKVDGSYLVHNDIQVLGGGTFDTGVYNTELSGGLSSGGTDGALTIIGTGSVLISGTNNLSGGAVIGTGTTLEVAGASGLGAGDVSMVAGSTVHFTTNNGTFTGNFLLDGDPVFDVDSGITTTLSGVIADAPSPATAGVLEKTGAGTLILNGANTYSGGTTLSGGFLQVGIDTVGTPGAITSSAIGTGTLAFGGGTLQAGGDYMLANAISLASAGGTVDANGHAFALTGVISGAHALGFTDSQGGGTVTVSGSSTYSGGTTIDGTTVIVNGGSAGPTTGPLGAGTITLNGGTLEAGVDGFLVNGIALDTNGGTLLVGGHNYFFGAISDSGGTPGGLTIGAAGDTGTVVLATGSSYTGGTTIAGGVARAQGSDSFGAASGAVTINDGAAAQYDDTVNIANMLILNGAARLTVTSGTATQSGDVLESAPSSLEKTGAGTLILSGSNNYSGATTISEGTLQASANGALPYNSDVQVASGATLAIDGALGLVEIGSLGDGAGAGGTVTVGSGTELYVGGAGSNSHNTTFSGTVTTGYLAYDGAGTLTLTGSGNSADQLIVCACVTTGGITLSGGDMTASDKVDVESGTLRIQDGAVLTVSGQGFASTGGAVLVTGAGSAISVDTDTGVTTDNTLTASQTVAAGGAFTTTGDSYVATDGSVGATATGLVTGSGSVWTANHVFVGSALLGGNGTLTIADGGKVVAPGGITLALGSTLNIGNGGLAGIVDTPTITGGGSNAIIADFTDTGSLSAVVSGGLTLTKQGSGTLILTGANTYGGLTTIGGGTLQIGNGGALGSGAVTDNGTLAFNTTAPTSVASIINGSGKLVQQGSGALTLTATDGYTGETTISAGATLKLAGSGRIQSSSVVNDNGVLDISGVAGGTAIQTLAGNGSVLIGSKTLQFLNGSTAFSGSITDGGAGGSVEFAGGSQVLTGTNSWTGTTTLGAGATLTVTSPSSLGSGALVFNNGSTLKFAGGGTYTQNAAFAQVHAPIYDVGSSNVTWAGQITGVGDLAVTGNGGTLTLTNTANSYGGGTEVYGGAAVKVDADSELGATATTLQLGDATSAGTLRFGGVFTLNAARSILLGAGGGVIDTNGNTVTIAQAITGGGLTKTGAGNLILTGASSFTGPTSVNGGVLSVNGSIASSAVTVNSGGTLGGSGTVGTTTVASGGTLAPGNSIGTLHVNGNLTFAGGSTYAAEVSPSAADQVAATGAANLGGTLALSQGAGTYADGTNLTLISATSVSGTFGNVTGASFTGLNSSIVYSATGVSLKLASPAGNGGGGSSGGGGGSPTNIFLFNTYGTTPNQVAAGTALAAASPTGTLYTAMGGVVSANTASVPAALGQSAGDIHASMRSAAIEDSRIIRDAVLGRLDQGGEDAAVWGSAFGGYGSIAGDGNAAALHHDSAGVIAGADLPLSDGIRAGIAAAYGTDRASTSGHLSTANSNNGHIIGYAGWSGGAFDLKLGGDYGWGTAHTARQVSALGQTLAGRQDQRMGQLFADAGYRIASDAGMFEPYAGIAHVETTSGSFAEQGGSAALSGGSVTDGVTYGTLGLRAALTALDDIITPKIDLGWRHAFDALKPGQLVSFQDSGTSFAVLGVPLESDAAALQLGFDVTLARDAKLSVGYDGTFGSRVQNNAIRGAFQWSF